MPENAIIPDGEAAPETVTETAKEKFERERLSRRQALKRFGMTSAMATFALFSVDDLARMVGKAMQQRAGDNKVAEQIAKEFQQAGIAFAQPGTPCSHCLAQYNQDNTNALAALGTCVANAQTTFPFPSQATATQLCDSSTFCPLMNYALYDYNGCCAANCTPSDGSPRISMPLQCMAIAL